MHMTLCIYMGWIMARDFTIDASEVRKSCHILQSMFRECFQHCNNKLVTCMYYREVNGSYTP